MKHICVALLVLAVIWVAPAFATPMVAVTPDEPSFFDTSLWTFLVVLILGGCMLAHMEEGHNGLAAINFILAIGFLIYQYLY